MTEGTVKWFNPRKGYGFITTEDDKDIFVDFSSIKGDGYRDLVEGEPVSFVVVQGEKGLRAENVVQIGRGKDTEVEKPDEEQQPAELVGLALVGGSIKLVALSYDGKYEFLDGLHNIHNILYVWSTETRVFERAVEELETMVNSHNAKEEDFQEFFERNPEFILNDEYKAAHSKIVLSRESGEKMIPDFVLEPIEQTLLCDILELKRPSANVFVLKKRRKRFSAEVMDACAQLREYSAYFDEERYRKNVEKKYRLNLYKPRMFVVIGRKGKISPIEVRRIEEDIPKLKLKTYDDLILRVKNRIERMKKGRI